LRAVHRRAGESSNKDAFEVAIFDFEDDAELVQPLIKATALVSRVPTPKDGGSTNITAAIEGSRQLLQAAAANPSRALPTSGQW